MDALFEKIRADSALAPFLKTCCEDEGMSVEMDSSITPDMFVILKPDQYYNSQHLSNTPASPDCLIVQQCVNGGYAVTLVDVDSEIDEAAIKKALAFEGIISVRVISSLPKQH